MKKILLCLCFVLAMISQVQAKEQYYYGYGMVNNIEEYFKKNGVPDNVSFFYEYGGEIKDDGTECSWILIGLVKNDQKHRNQILSLMSSNCRIEFKQGNYSYRERVKNYKKLVGLKDENMKNIVFMKSDDKILVGVDEKNIKTYQQKLEKEYGKIIEVVNDNTIGYKDSTIIEDIPKVIDEELFIDNSSFQPILIYSCAFVFLLLFFFSRFYHLEFINGRLIFKKIITNNYIKDKITGSYIVPSKTLDEKILNRS